MSSPLCLQKSQRSFKMKSVVVETAMFVYNITTTKELHQPANAVSLHAE
jgi:hypothetical protein